MRHLGLAGASYRLLVFAGIIMAVLAWEIGEGEAASRATVKEDAVAVYSQMSRTSPVLTSLKRGDEVTIDFAISGPEGEWCSISQAAKTASSGYVLCAFLEQEPQPRWKEAPVRPPVSTDTRPAGGRVGGWGAGPKRDVAREVREFKKSVRGKTGGDTPLMQAAAAGDAVAVQALVAQGASVNAANRTGETALMFAAENGHVAIVRALLAARSAVDSRNIFRETALIMAAGNGHTEVVQILASAGANVNARDDSTSPALAMAADGGHTSTVQTLLAAGANANAHSDGGYTALINAAGNGHADTVKALLAAGADVNYSYHGGGRSRPLTALLMAKSNGHDDIVRLLREAGARQ